jgi:hypothetical protein
MVVAHRLPKKLRCNWLSYMMLKLAHIYDGETDGYALFPWRDHHEALERQ